MVTITNSIISSFEKCVNNIVDYINSWDESPCITAYDLKFCIFDYMHDPHYIEPYMLFDMNDKKMLFSMLFNMCNGVDVEYLIFELGDDKIYSYDIYIHWDENTNTFEWQYGERVNI